MLGTSAELYWKQLGGGFQLNSPKLPASSSTHPGQSLGVLWWHAILFRIHTRALSRPRNILHPSIPSSASSYDFSRVHSTSQNSPLKYRNHSSPQTSTLRQKIRTNVSWCNCLRELRWSRRAGGPEGEQALQAGFAIFAVVATLWLCPVLLRRVKWF